MGFESINQPGQSSEVECNLKNEHFIFLAGEGWQMGFESIDQPANHLDLNVIQKWAFYFFGWRKVEDGVRVHQPAGQSSGFECNPKMSILFFWLERGGRMGFESINQPSQSSEVEHNTKMSISFFWLQRGGEWGLSPSTSPADHQKLNVIQKWAFYFFGWRGVADGVRVYRPARPNTRNWM